MFRYFNALCVLSLIGGNMKESKFQFSKPYIENIVFNPSNENIKTKTFEIKNEFGVKIEELNENKRESKVSLEVKLGTFLSGTEDFDKSGFPFYIEITMSANFKFEEIDDRKLIDELLKRNAPVLLLSYVRPIVHYLTSLSKFPPYDIPFFDFTNE